MANVLLTWIPCTQLGEIPLAGHQSEYRIIFVLLKGACCRDQKSMHSGFQGTSSRNAFSEPGGPDKQQFIALTANSMRRSSTPA